MDKEYLAKITQALGIAMATQEFVDELDCLGFRMDMQYSDGNSGEITIFTEGKVVKLVITSIEEREL